MTTTPHLTRRSLMGIAGAAAGAGLLSACGGGNDTKSSDKEVTVKWWHITTADPNKTVFQGLADDFHAKNPKVKIEINILENEAFKDKLKTISNAADYPDVFQSWGGGVLQQQVDAGLVKDLTSATSSWIGNLSPTGLIPYKISGKLYGIPYNSGMVGFWYNSEKFQQAGITTLPSTWDDLLAAIGKLKAAGITPIALAGKDKWPGHFYWSYLAMRIGGMDLLPQAVKDKDFNKPDLVKAFTELKRLADLQPFQKGFADTAYTTGQENQAAFMGNGLCAMELMGQWGPSTEASFSTDKKGQGEKIKFLPFPTVAGGKGKVTDCFGGTDGFAVGAKAPSQAVDFVKFLLEADSQRKIVAGGGILPVTKGAEDALKDPEQKKVQQTLASASGFQLYLDQAYAPAIGQQINDSCADVILGKATPEAAVKAITNAAKGA